MGPRRAGRQAAVQILYAMDTAGALDQGTAEIRAYADRHFVHLDPEVPAEARLFAVELCQQVVTRRQELDALLEQSSDRWRVARMNRVDRNVLRVAAAELIGGQGVPEAVVLDEAIELAKALGGEASGRFINGVLGRVAGRRGGGGPSSGTG